jgi:hypothetical protein
MQSIRISYGQSSIMRCSIALAYDRFFTDFTSHQSGVPVTTGTEEASAINYNTPEYFDPINVNMDIA